MNEGALLAFPTPPAASSTVKVKYTDVSEVPSLAVTLISSSAGASSVPGVPAKARAVAVKASQSGNALPSASAAE